MADTHARVTVAVRTMNRPGFLRRALEDVLAQDYEAWHMVVLNDGDDIAGVKETLSPYEERLAGRITLVDPAERQGRQGAGNRAVEVRDDEYVVLHDDDDTWAPTFLSTTVAHLDEHPDALGVATATDIIYEERDGDGYRETGRAPFGPPRDVVTLFDLLLINRWVPIAFLFRRSAWEQVGRFDPSIVATGDWDFNIRLATAGQIDYLPGEPLAFWHQRLRAEGADANSMFAEADSHYLFDRIVRDRKIREHLERTGGGDLLYLSKYIDERAHQTEHELRTRIDNLEHELARRTDHLEAQIRYYSLGETISRNLKKLFRRRP
ncbi:glycosyltransferase [Demequina sp. NBRC 110052]|uniref:glycosyltransferase family 2 protein n=1 Tax=Demequina sp. NBRC 110052 TaxID=1570341 RepID=UPI000A07854E|nr:glycosyltransferase [Demequina sp. NBRC 110052]